MVNYFDKLEPGMTKEEESLSRNLLELRHLLESGRLNASEVRKRLQALANPTVPQLRGGEVN